MSRHAHPIATVIAGTLCLALGFTNARSQEADSQPVLLHDEADGLVAVDSIGAIRIVGISGKVSLRTGKEGELRYASRSRDDRSTEKPVALWMRDGTLELSALAGTETERLWVEMTVPPGLAVDVDLDDSEIEVAGLRSALGLRGSKLAVQARGIYGDVVVDAANSDVGIDGVDGSVEIDGEALRLTVRNVSSSVSGVLSGGNAEIVDVRGTADFDLQGTVLAGQRFDQGVRVSADASRVELGEVRRDADLRLSDTPLVLSGGQGRFTVDSDADVQLDSVQGMIAVTGYGASVNGSGNSGRLDISTSQGAIVLNQHTGVVHVEGDGLQIEMHEQRGDVTVVTTGSEVLIEQVEGAADVTNDFGDVRIDGTSRALRIANVEGSIFASAIAGPVEVHGSGERVEVDWKAVADEGAQSISNEQGQVVAKLPANSRCRIEVESSYGTVRSEIPAVRVSDDERFASGVLGSVQTPVIQIRSAGDVLVTASGGAAAALPTQ